MGPDFWQFLIFYPAVLWLIVVCADQSRGYKSNLAWHFAMILVNPCLILIDHGHSQCNCIRLGLTVGAVAAILCDKDLVGSFLFSLALNHKQMSAYFAPAFFSYLLGKSLKRQNPLLEVAKLSMVVIGTFAIVWWPYLHSTAAFFEVLSRLQIRAPSNRAFLYRLLNSAFSFYLFSFQGMKIKMVTGCLCGDVPREFFTENFFYVCILYGIFTKCILFMYLFCMEFLLMYSV